MSVPDSGEIAISMFPVARASSTIQSFKYSGT